MRSVRAVPVEAPLERRDRARHFRIPDFVIAFDSFTEIHQTPPPRLKGPNDCNITVKQSRSPAPAPRARMPFPLRSTSPLSLPPPSSGSMRLTEPLPSLSHPAPPITARTSYSGVPRNAPLIAAHTRQIEHDPIAPATPTSARRSTTATRARRSATATSARQSATSAWEVGVEIGRSEIYS